MASVTRKTGQEKFRSGGALHDFDLLGFWQWSASDLVSNTMRGVLAEYIVAEALGIAKDRIRDEWDAVDLETPTGIKVEVKSAAYVQSWHQDRHSVIQFNVEKRRAWDRVTNQLSLEAGRHAHVYVFALLSHQDRTTLDPMELGQWEFYVVATRVLDERTRSQHSITLKSLKDLAGHPVAFADLALKVRIVAQVR